MGAKILQFSTRSQLEKAGSTMGLGHTSMTFSLEPRNNAMQDPSGRMKGHLHPGCLEEHGPNLGPGAAILLKEASKLRKQGVRFV